MPTKSSRFSRTAYARRANALADELDDWWAIYKTRLAGNPPFLWSQKEADVLEARTDRLQDLIIQLRNVASELTSLR